MCTSYGEEGKHSVVSHCNAYSPFRATYSFTIFNDSQIVISLQKTAQIYVVLKLILFPLAEAVKDIKPASPVSKCSHD